MTDSTFQASSRGVGELFKDHDTLIIPSFQRSYSWSADDAAELYNDLIYAGRTSKSDYFIGNILLKRLLHEEGRRAEIIDGQQRLTTIAIFMASIRDQMLELGFEDDARHISETYINKKVRISGRLSSVACIQLNDDANKFLSDLLQGSQSSKHAHLSAIQERATITIRDALRVSRQQGVQDHDALWGLVYFLQTRAKVVVILVPDDHSGHLIFEALNARGVPLSIADLLKNFIFANAHPLEEARSHWEATLKVLGDGSLRAYIGDLWRVAHGAAPSDDRALYREIKRRLRQESSNVMSFARRMSKNAKWYAALGRPEHPAWEPYGEQVKDSIQLLVNVLSFGVYKYPVMSLLEMNYDAQVIKEVLCALITYAVRARTVRNMPTSPESLLVRLAPKLQASKKGADEINDLIYDAMKTWDAGFEREFSAMTSFNNSYVRYLLWSLEAKKANLQRRVENLCPNNIVSLPIMPQHPSNDWHGIAKETMIVLHNRLGNQVLLEDELAAHLGKFASFNDKKAVFARSNVRLTRELARYSRWGGDEIDERQRSLAVMADSLWRLDARSNRSQVDPDSTLDETEQKMIFINYSKIDESLYDKLKVHLQGALRDVPVTLWSEEQINPGMRRKDAIRQAIARSKVAILLVSPHFLASDFVLNRELDQLLESYENRKIKLIWLYVRSCNFEHTELRDIQPAHDRSRPLDSLTRHELNVTLTAVARHVKTALEEE